MGGHNGVMEDRFSGEFVRIYSTSSLTDGYLARGRLESEGIPVMLKGEGEGPYRMGPTHLWVPSEFEVQARMILQEIREGSMRLPAEGDMTADTDWSEAETGPSVD
jgi:hypothetical protein